MPFLPKCNIISGIPSFLLLNTTDLEFPGRLTRLELRDLEGNLLLEMPITWEVTHPSLYNLSSFVPPEVFFYVKVTVYFVLSIQ